MFELGCMFLYGEGGRRNIPRAIQLLSAAAKAGDIDAVKVLLHGYRTGDNGIPRSPHKVTMYRNLYSKIKRSDSEQLVQPDASSGSR
jgi:TPR repeat protein